MFLPVHLIPFAPGTGTCVLGPAGMEATAALVANSIQPTMVFPEPHCSKLF